MVEQSNGSHDKRQHNEVYEADGQVHHCGDDIGTVPTEDIPDHDLRVGGSLVRIIRLRQP